MIGFSKVCVDVSPVVGYCRAGIVLEKSDQIPS